MGRSAKFTEDDFLDAALSLLAEGGTGAATITKVAERMAAPVGSVYHRFASRDLLLARLWVRTVRRFQHGYLERLTDDDLDVAATGAALHVVRWAREHPAEARVLTLYRQQDLVARWPDELDPELSTLNDAATAAVRRHARRRYGRADAASVRRVSFAIVDVPYAAVRPHLLAGEAPPAMLDAMVVTACRSVLAAGRARR
ncbi:TetR/AcrR family transcriptional regulator [Amycolatopsis arida]|uniref:TetR/AcrR family transcriptional regulator n=1 Tax=Amycolatopsis arida TaxID=587909 RepID=UPI0010661A85|nr:TetR/AcrR family transcriptional regulator [Amycolatopsis arida]